MRNAGGVIEVLIFLCIVGFISILIGNLGARMKEDACVIAYAKQACEHKPDVQTTAVFRDRAFRCVYTQEK